MGHDTTICNGRRLLLRYLTFPARDIDVEYPEKKSVEETMSTLFDMPN